MSNSKSLSGHKAVGSKRAAEGNRNEASTSIEPCILQKVQMKNGGVITCLRETRNLNIFRYRESHLRETATCDLYRSIETHNDPGA